MLETCYDTLPVCKQASIISVCPSTESPCIAGIERFEVELVCAVSSRYFRFCVPLVQPRKKQEYGQHCLAPSILRHVIEQPFRVLRDARPFILAVALGSQFIHRPVRRIVEPRDRKSTRL